MQGLSFDDADFNPSSVPVSSSWIESSTPQINPHSNPSASSAPALPSPQHPNQSSHPHLSSPVVTDEDLYRIVTANPPIDSHPSSIRVNQSAHTPTGNNRLHSTSYPLPYHSNHPPTSRQSVPPHSYALSIPTNKPISATGSHLNPTNINARNSNYSTPGLSPRMPVQPYPSLSTPIRKQNTQFHHPNYANTPSPLSAPGMVNNYTQNEPRPRVPQQPHRISSAPHVPASTSMLPSTALPLLSPHAQALPAATKRRSRAVRSAVEEARMRAQREAESYAHSRKDGGKREITHSSASGTTIQGAGSPGSARGMVTAATLTPKPEKRKGIKRNRIDLNGVCREESLDRIRDIGNAAMDDSEAEKQERYQRRLDMNRESAAVSRVRRRAYVKELEERLAAVEAEKFQLEGKLEIMMSQNESFKRQLNDLFVMVANGQRPVCPPGINEFSMNTSSHGMGTSIPGMALNTNSGSGGPGQTTGGSSLVVHVQSQGLDSA